MSWAAEDQATEVWVHAAAGGVQVGQQVQVTVGAGYEGGQAEVEPVQDQEAVTRSQDYAER